VLAPPSALTRRSTQGKSIPTEFRSNKPMPPMSRDLTDAQWAILDAIIPEPLRRTDGRGRQWKDRRTVLNGILWVLRTGAPWADVPDRYPSYQACHRRFQQWVRSGVMKGIVEALALELKSEVKSLRGLYSDSNSRPNADPTLPRILRPVFAS
jgi:transposase